VGMHLIHTWTEDALKVVSSDQLKADTWTLVSMTYDGSGKAEGVGIFFDGKPQKPKVETNKFKKHTIRTDVPLVIGGRSQGATAHAVGLADLTVWGRRLSVAEVEGLSRAELQTSVWLRPVVSTTGGWAALTRPSNRSAARKRNSWPRTLRSVAGGRWPT
jgi:hypothetical protein